MIPKFDLKPRNDSKIVLFANKGEAVVFWISVAAVLFLAVLYIFRYFTFKDMPARLATMKSEQQQLILEIDYLKEQNQKLQKQLDSLAAELRKRGQTPPESP
ncbi:MAG: hypothetical protein Kow0042_22130 [Calditrichia bacterium]